MTTTAIIGADTPLGIYWSGKRYFDCLIQRRSYDLLKRQQFGHLILICPSLWEAPSKTGCAGTELTTIVTELIEALGEARIERLTYITSLALIPDDGDETSRIDPETASACQLALAGLDDYLNLQFGRVITLRLAELVNLDTYPAGWSVLAELSDAEKEGRKPDAGLLTKHQFYPIDRIVSDAETAWECGIVQANLVSEPITIFDLAERLFPQLIDKLPVAHESDPFGSRRTSGNSFYWDDATPGFIIDRERMITSLKGMLSR